MPRESKVDRMLRMSIMANVALAIAVVALAASFAYTGALSPHAQYAGSTTLHPSNSSGAHGTSTAKPVENATAPFTFQGIDQPFNGSELAGINNEPLSYYEQAGERLLNGTLTDQVLVQPSPQYNALVVNGKPSVVYVGALSCIFCGENRWSMALALARFGNFTALYHGYSALSDAHVPTIYWTQVNYTTPGGVAYGASYASNYINFLAADYESPILIGGFQFARNGVQYFVQGSPNATYLAAMKFMNGTGKFQGTPFTLWGTSLFAGADAVVFGNSTPSSGSLPLSNMSSAQVIAQLKGSTDQFAWGEYAGADVYIASVCPTINNTAAVCNLPAIKRLEAKVV